MCAGIVPSVMHMWPLQVLPSSVVMRRACAVPPSGETMFTISSSPNAVVYCMLKRMSILFRIMVVGCCLGRCKYLYAKLKKNMCALACACLIFEK